MTVEVRDLSVHVGGAPVLTNFSLSLTPGRVHAVVGPSGSGKTMAALAVLGLLPEGATVTNRPVDSRSGFAMVLQEPLTALNPVLSIGAQLHETLKVHGQPPARALELLDEVGFSEGKQRLHAYPHELSGGQRQRLAIACALAANPKVLIADEPTTALDASSRNVVLELLRTLARNRGLAVWLISHDLKAVEHFADEILPLPAKRGERPVVEAPLPASPRFAEGGDTLLRADGVHVHYGATHAVKGVSLALHRGERLGLVGESGSGKSSLARALLGLAPISAGTITFDGQPVHGATKALRRRFQPVFQDVGAALDPRLTIATSLAEPRELHGLPPADLEALLRAVELPPEVLSRLPKELSTGQRQRVNIARALTLDPDVLILDEPVSALDPQVQRTVLALLERLAAERALSLLVITHDLEVVQRLCTTVAVMRHGSIVETGAVDTVLTQPQHDYTRQLLAAHVLAQPPHA